MPLTQKLSIGALFCLGFVCIAVATIRVKELGSTINNTQPSTTWLALWGIVESSIGTVTTHLLVSCISNILPAVIIGCGPGLYRKAKTIYQTRHGSRPSRGYVQYANSNSGARVQQEGIVLGDYSSSKRSRAMSGSKMNDATSSQEELRHTNLEPGKGEAKMANESVRDKDVDSMRHWDDRPHAF